MPRRRPLTTLHNSNDLARIEAFCDALVDPSGVKTRANAARIIGYLERDRRDKIRAKNDPRFTATIRVGMARAQAIDALLKDAGWTLHETVNRKLPLLKLPEELKKLIRDRSLEPSKALLLNRVTNLRVRRELTERVLKGMTQKQLYAVIYGADTLESKQVDTDFKWISAQASSQFGTRVMVRPNKIEIDCGTLEILNAVIERMGVQL